MMLRADELDAAQPKPGRMAWRRVPGTAALAGTNLMAAGLLVDVGSFDASSVHIIARTLMPAEAWGALFLLSGVCLVVAAITRRLGWLNAGSVISLFAWTAISLSTFAAWLGGDVPLSPVAGALVVWMVAGQAAMLIVPLLGDGAPA